MKCTTKSSVMYIRLIKVHKRVHPASVEIRLPETGIMILIINCKVLLGPLFGSN